MNYQVFARKWRPKKFSDIAGQQDVVTAITHSFKLDRIHHAYIFYGTRGIGKTTIARLFAKGLNCEQGLMYDVCGSCKNCQDIELGCFTDLIEIDAAYYTKVEDMRDCLDNIYYAPSHGRFKVYLLDEVHMLSKHSFNALLKILEEPPKHVKFILITTEYKKLPETIVSRCLTFYLKPLSVSQIVSKLLHICTMEQINVSEDSLKLLAYEARGSMRDALNLLEQVILFSNNNITIDIVHNMIGTLDIEQPLSLIENLIDGNVDSLMNKIYDYEVLGINWDSLFKEILTVFQKIAIHQFSSNFLRKTVDKESHIPSHIISRIYALSNRIKPENVQLYYQIFLLSRRELPYAPSFREGMEMAVLRALAFFPSNINTDNNYHQDNLNNFKNKDNTSFLAKQTLSTSKSDINTSSSSNHLLINDIACNNADLKKIEYSNDHNHPVNMDCDFDSNTKKIIPNFTNKILDVRSKLIKSRQHLSQLNSANIQSNSDMLSRHISEDILDKFSNIYLDINNKSVDNKKKK